MDLMNKRVKVISGYYRGIEGIVTGSTIDNYYLVTSDHHNRFFVKEKELLILHVANFN